MNANKIFLVIAFLALAVSSASAARVENVGYGIDVKYESGSISAGDAYFTVPASDIDYDLQKRQQWMNYDVPDKECTPKLEYDGHCCISSLEKACYRALLYSAEGALLYEMPFKIDLVINLPPPDAPEAINASDTTVGLPYYMEAQTLRVTKDGEQLLEIDLSTLANCEVLEKCKGSLVEPGLFESCPASCSAPAADGRCDAYKDGYYDTDCLLDEDPDCIGNEQWCLQQLYGVTVTPQPGETTVTYSFSGRDMVVEITKPAQGELPAGAEAQIKTDMQAMFTVLNMTATGTTAKVVNGQLVVTTTVKNLLSESLAATFTPVPEYKTVVKGAQTIAPTPDSLENGVATYNIAPASITVSYGGEAGFDWLLWAVVVLVLIIGAWLVKRNLR